MQDFSGPLAAIVGPEYVRGLGEAVAVAPGNTEEIAAVLRLAQENHLSSGGMGGGKKMSLGQGLVGAISRPICTAYHGR